MADFDVDALLDQVGAFDIPPLIPTALAFAITNSFMCNDKRAALQQLAEKRKVAESSEHGRARHSDIENDRPRSRDPDRDRDRERDRGHRDRERERERDRDTDRHREHRDDKGRDGDRHRSRDHRDRDRDRCASCAHHRSQVLAVTSSSMSPFVSAGNAAGDRGLQIVIRNGKVVANTVLVNMTTAAGVRT
jgi:hypothetical protein